MLTYLLSLAISLALAVFLYGTARTFVRDRLRYVPAAQGGAAPWLAGGATFLVGLVLVPILPLVGAGTALTAALAVGGGVAAGARDVRRGAAPVPFRP